jgi:aspartate kinase
MIVMKFGGTSVGSAPSIRNVHTIVARQVDSSRPLVVVSALAGVTDLLVDLARRAPIGDGIGAALARLVDRHRDVLGELDLATDLLDPLFVDLSDLTRGMKLVGEASPRAVDALLSFGERCSARLVAAFFNAQGLRARAVDAFDLGLRTDSNFGRARPLPDDGRIARAVATHPDEVLVVTGFIARDEQGNLTTLGRNGSDYSAALLGNALSADEIQIWKDVDGVMTADPKMVENARPIPVMSFDEASELAYYGGKVLHPAAIQPAMEKSIPVRVLNTSQPDSPGTLILKSYAEPGVTVRSVVYKRGIHLINLVSPRMLQQHGFLARVFEAAARHQVDVDLVATSEVSITMTTESADNLAALRADLAAIGDVSVESDHALVCVVGRGIASEFGVAASVLQALADARVAVRVISQGAVKVNIALVVPAEHLGTAITALHDRFFIMKPGEGPGEVAGAASYAEEPGNPGESHHLQV